MSSFRTQGEFRLICDIQFDMKQLGLYYLAQLLEDSIAFMLSVVPILNDSDQVRSEI